jgi:hypothetical protein
MNYLKLALLICGLSLNTYCQAQFSIEVISAPQNTLCNGQLKVNTSANNGPYSFAWSNGGNTQQINQLCSGPYSVTITSVDGCLIELGTLLSGGTDCPDLENETFEATIEGSCTDKNDGVISIQNTGGFDYNWSGLEGKTSTVTDLLPGHYCVTISEPTVSGCSIIKCYTIPIKANCDPKGVEDTIKGETVLLVNEISNGPANGQEFIELVVVKVGKQCGPVDIRGFVIDDNNGDFSITKGGSAAGVAPGHFRFSQSPVWESVPLGSIILLYNSAAKNPAIQLPDDPTDADNDKVYVVPSGSDLIGGDSKSPTLSSNYYEDKEPELASWNSVFMYDGGDAIQVRAPDGKYTHGISYGSSLKMNGGPDNLLVSTLSGVGRGYAFTSGSITTASNYLSYDVSNGGETPGAPNDKVNGSYIKNLCSGSGGGNTGSNPIGGIGGKSLIGGKIGLVSAYPNPFTKHIQLEIQSEERQDVQIVLTDLNGAIVAQWSLELKPGIFTTRLSLNNKKLAAGLYTLSGSTEASGTVFATKLIKLQ